MRVLTKIIIEGLVFLEDKTNQIQLQIRLLFITFKTGNLNA